MPREITPRNEHLTRARMDAGLTQGQLARIAGLSRQIVNQYERLQARPTPETGDRIAYILSRRTDQSLRYSDLFPVVRDSPEDEAA